MMFGKNKIAPIANAKTKRALLVIVTMLLVLGSFALISIKGTSDIISENQEIEELQDFEEDYQEDYMQPTGQAKLIPKNGNIDDFIIKQPVITKATYSPTITKISWEAPESLVKKGSYTKFLQLIGKNIKLNLQNDLLLVSDIPLNKTVRVDINIASNGNVNSIKMANSSGTVSIDNSIEKIINETLTYMKPPSLGIMSKSADITLTIELN